MANWGSKRLAWRYGPSRAQSVMRSLRGAADSASSAGAGVRIRDGYQLRMLRDGEP